MKKVHISRTKSTTGVNLPVEGPEAMTYAKNTKREARVFEILLLVWQVFIVIIFALWFDYPTSAEDISFSVTRYNYFRDVSIMIFFGFGFLMTFLRRYGYSAIGYTLLISAVVVEWSLIVEAFFKTVNEENINFNEIHSIGIFELVNGLFCAGAVMISYGAILGKVSPAQMLMMGFFETIFYHLNIFITIFKLRVLDVGGGMVIHTFGAYFGLAVTWFLTNSKTHGHKDNCSSYNSDTFALAGSLFLWIMWPSFNAAIAASGQGEVRALVNTVISLCSSVIGAFFFSRVMHGGKFDIVHIQNSTLAGGVVLGVAADLNITLAGAVGAGFCAGALSVIGYQKLAPVLARKFNIQDICGVHNLHGMPGVLSCIVGVFACLHAAFQPDKYVDFATRFPHGINQAGFQLAGLAITLAIAILAGIGVGIIMGWMKSINDLETGDYFNDSAYWGQPSDYQHVVDPETNEQEMK